MSPRWTEAELRAHRQKQLKQSVAKPSKYKAVKTVVDGITFDSKKEAQRYHELKLLEKAGQIHALFIQPSYRLMAVSIYGALPKDVGVYRADFSYCTCKSKTGCDDKLVVEDVKGMKTALYRWKKKHFEAQYDIKILET